VRTTLKMEAMTRMGRTRAVETTMSFRKEGMTMRKRKKTRKRMLLRLVSSAIHFARNALGTIANMAFYCSIAWTEAEKRSWPP
jgi:hypothetical protein